MKGKKGGMVERPRIPPKRSLPCYQGIHASIMIAQTTYRGFSMPAVQKRRSRLILFLFCSAKIAEALL